MSVTPTYRVSGPRYPKCCPVRGSQDHVIVIRRPCAIWCQNKGNRVATGPKINRTQHYTLICWAEASTFYELWVKSFGSKRHGSSRCSSYSNHQRIHVAEVETAVHMCINIARAGCCVDCCWIKKKDDFINTLRPMVAIFADGIFKLFFVKGNVWISPEFVSKRRIPNIGSGDAKQAINHYLDQWWSASMTHICVTRPRSLLICALTSSIKPPLNVIYYPYHNPTPPQFNATKFESCSNSLLKCHHIQCQPGKAYGALPRYTNRNL